MCGCNRLEVILIWTFILYAGFAKSVTVTYVFWKVHSSAIITIKNCPACLSVAALYSSVESEEPADCNNFSGSLVLGLLDNRVPSWVLANPVFACYRLHGRLSRGQFLFGLWLSSIVPRYEGGVTPCTTSSRGSKQRRMTFSTYIGRCLYSLRMNWLNYV